MIFPATEQEARAQGFSFAYRTTCLSCGKPIRFFRTPRGTFIAFDSGPAFQSHADSCLALESLGRKAAS